MVIQFDQDEEILVKGETFDVFDLKEAYKSKIKNIADNWNSIQIDEKDTISLFHGTSTHYLNSILALGLLPRKDTDNSNWEHHASIDNVVYLTRKWHYFFAHHSARKLNHDAGTPSIPCYIECKVPKALLVPDEDFIVSKYVVEKFNRCVKKGTLFALDWEESLKYYGTVGVLGGVLPQYIESFTILGEPQFFAKIMDERGQYHKDWWGWQNGKGKGTLKLKDLLLMESMSNRNGTWQISELGKNPQIKNVQLDETRQQIQLAWSHQ